MKPKWTVRVINYSGPKLGRDSLSGLWLEQLRYAGIAYPLDREQSCGPKFPDDFYTVVEIPAPADVRETKAWADMNAKRMRSFGINAVAAPAWDRREDLPKPRFMKED